MKSKVVVYGLLAAVAVAVGIWYFSGAESGSGNISAKVQRGPFEVRVFTTGELEAKNSVEVKGPKGLRAASIWRVQISDIVDEGTVVKKGDYIAALDRTEIASKLKDAQSELLQIQSQFTQTKLDTAIDLRQARENLVNLDYQLREKKITLEQSQYEPPATIRQAEIELEKATNALTEANENYDLKIQQARAKMQEVEASRQIANTKLELLNQVQAEFNIIAPEDGMVIYERDWEGRKKGVGSEVGAWDPTVATLPDLSVMISKTYVNEVDIRKIEMGQRVEISLDAFPDKSLTGEVISVANVGEQLKGTDAKVFEVMIQVEQSDTTLRPSMTTGNNIVTEKLEDALYIPLEAIDAQGDSLVFSYVKKGFGTVKQELVLGSSNSNHAVVLAGLAEGDEVLLTRPEGHEDLAIERLPNDQKIATTDRAK